MNELTPSTDDQRLARVRDWLETIQERIIAAMEALEREFAGISAGRPPGRFVIEPWERTDASGAQGGGGRIAMLRGRLFEKMGAHFSAVHGAFPAEFASQIPGAETDPPFSAAGG
jgi:coproporphyrinogen III oxidase